MEPRWGDAGDKRAALSTDECSRLPLRPPLARKLSAPGARARAGPIKPQGGILGGGADAELCSLEKQGCVNTS